MPHPFDSTRTGEMLIASIARNTAAGTADIKATGTGAGTVVALVQWEIIQLFRKAGSTPQERKRIMETFDLALMALCPALTKTTCLADAEFRRDFNAARQAFAADLNDLIDGKAGK